MDDKRNMILAVLLTGLILFGWPLLTEQFFPDLATKPAAQQSEAAKSSGTGNDPAAAGLPVSSAGNSGTTTQPLDGVGGKAQTVAAALKSGNRVAIDTPRLKGSINLAGARIDDITLTDYRVDLDKKSPPVRLFSPAGTPNAYFARFGWAGQGVELPGDASLWTADGTSLTPQKPLTLRWTNAGGHLFEIKLSIDSDYLITATQKVSNNGAAPIAVTPYGLISRQYRAAEVPTSEADSWTIHIGPMGVFGGTANYDWDYDDVAAEGAKGAVPEGDAGWLGFTDKYWLAALIPDGKTKVDAKFRAGAGDLYQTQIADRSATVIAPGKAFAQTSRLFAGAKETRLLDRYKDEFNVPLFDRAIDWGWFYWFEKPIFYLLLKLFEYFGNFGVAIILLTFIVRGIMFPIAQRQFASMAQMRAVQPKMKAIQDRFKDDKPKQQQEIMKLYKDEKVNPLAGCLPIFLQIPIFFALYKVLMLAIEMRHQPFFGWILDLSAPDPLTPVNLFGLLPFYPPAFLAIGILPILMGITMHLQFKLNPAPMDPIQQQIFAFMPVIMVFIMAPFAAGLQLYWTVSNILTIAQQKWLYSRHPQMKEAMAREAAEKAKAK